MKPAVLFALYLIVDAAAGAWIWAHVTGPAIHNLLAACKGMP